MFRDRVDAGRQLAKKLMQYGGKSAVVLALPRGGVVLGFEIARALSVPLDIIAVRKIGHPFHPEYAIGAVDESGARILNEAEAATLDEKWLAVETEREMNEAKRRSSVYRGEKRAEPLAKKIAIVVDDGIATGLTMQLAVRVVRALKPSKIVVAVPVAPAEALRALKDEGADETIVLEPPETFMGAVGAHYMKFDQVEDDEVIRLLKLAHEAGNKHSG
ncbi:phosphoribosyl transferase [Candidatus Kaiserbacteria bacterium]|nr:phosphoribosyl transferase [Candidatus Kaiserbacteria bacterium]